MRVPRQSYSQPSIRSGVRPSVRPSDRLSNKLNRRPDFSVTPRRDLRPPQARGGIFGKIALVLGPLLLLADAADLATYGEEVVNKIMASSVYDRKALNCLEKYALWSGADDFQPTGLSNFYALPMGIEKNASGIVAGRGFLPKKDLNVQMAFAYEVPSVGANWSKVVDHSQLFVELSQAAKGEFLGCFYVNQGRYHTDLSFEELLDLEIRRMREEIAKGTAPRCEHAGGGQFASLR